MQANTSTAIWPPEETTPPTQPGKGVRALRFGRGNASHVEWRLRRNCSMAPRQLLLAYGVVSAIALVVAGFMWTQGATLVMPFAWVELIGLGLALLVYARHANDAETIVLHDGRVVVEHTCAQRTQRTEFDAAWLRVEPAVADGSLIELSGDGRRASVGRYVRPEWREALAGELRAAMRGWRERAAGRWPRD